MRIDTASTRSDNRMRSCSAFSRVPTRVPIWAPTTPPRISTSAKSMSTVWLVTACMTVVKAVTKMI